MGTFRVGEERLNEPLDGRIRFVDGSQRMFVTQLKVSYELNS
jgi:hypothetical protein